MKNRKKNLNIAIEAIALGETDLTGIGNLAFNFLKQIQRLDNDNQYILYSMRSPKHLKDTAFARHAWKCIDVLFEKREKTVFDLDNHRGCHLKHVYLKLTGKILGVCLVLVQSLYRYWIPFSLLIHRVDIYVSTSAYFYPPFFLSRLKKISWVYDLTWKLFPETMEPGNLKQMQRFSEKNIKKTDHLVPISENTKRDVRKHLGISTPHTVIPPAADKELFYPASGAHIKKVKEKYGIHHKYILSVCTLEPRKNLKILLETYRDIHDAYAYQLVLAGKMGWQLNDLLASINGLDIRHDIVLTGFVPSDDLAPLYSGAEVFVYPSIYEGFGLPVLEAMQCGCPVIAADNSSIPEVAGDAGILVPGDDQKALTDALKILLSKEEIRKAMIEKGLKRAEKFSWEASAKHFLKLYSSI